MEVYWNVDDPVILIDGYEISPKGLSAIPPVDWWDEVTKSEGTWWVPCQCDGDCSCQFPPSKPSASMGVGTRWSASIYEHYKLVGDIIVQYTLAVWPGGQGEELRVYKIWK